MVREERVISTHGWGGYAQLFTQKVLRTFLGFGVNIKSRKLSMRRPYTAIGLVLIEEAFLSLGPILWHLRFYLNKPHKSFVFSCINFRK